MIDAIIGYGGFWNINKFLRFFYDKKRASNLTSAFHATNAIILSSLYLKYNEHRILNYLTHFSTGYFIFDAIDILFNQKLTPVQLGYIYHHISSLYLVQRQQYPHLVTSVFFWGELSNIPGYFLYHYLHSKGNHQKKIKLLRILQKWIYVKIRIFILTKIIYDFIQKNENYSSLLPVFPVYFMGVGWSLKILSQ